MYKKTISIVTPEIHGRVPCLEESSSYHFESQNEDCRVTVDGAYKAPVSMPTSVQAASVSDAWGLGMSHRRSIRMCSRESFASPMSRTDILNGQISRLIFGVLCCSANMRLSKINSTQPLV